MNRYLGLDVDTLSITHLNELIFQQTYLIWRIGLLIDRLRLLINWDQILKCVLMVGVVQLLFAKSKVPVVEPLAHSI